MERSVADQLWEAAWKCLLNALLIHLVCRFVNFVRRPIIYDESPYLMKLVNKDESDDIEEVDDSTEKSSSPKMMPQLVQHKSKRKSTSRSKSPHTRSINGAENTGKQLIVVTGSSGRIGSAVVRALVEDGSFLIRGLDRHEPPSMSKYDGVDYRVIDLVEASEKDVLEALSGVDAIIHCAGVLALYDTPAFVHNNITYLTLRLASLARKAGCTGFVHTSSTIVINNGKLNLNAIPPDSPYVEDQLHPWGKAQLKTEQSILKASDNPKDASGKFFTCSNRIPGIYGFNDRLVYTVMIEGELSIFPNRTDVRVELLYMKNVAHAHLCAARSLLNPSSRVSAAGQAFVITQSPEGETSTNLEFWTRARRAMGVKRSFVILPTWIFYLTARFFEFQYWYFQGMVPKSVIWNFTTPFLNSILHDNTFLGQSEAFHGIGYKPLFSNASSFEDMARELREAAKGSSSSRVSRTMLNQLDHDPKDDIDWEPRLMPKNLNFFMTLFYTMLGPGVSYQEIVMFLTLQVCSHLFAYAICQRYEYSALQSFFAHGLAGWHIPATVMSTSPSCKRWFHNGGNLGLFMLFLMILDIIVSCTIAGWNFGEKTGIIWIFLSGALLMLGLFIIVFLVPLAHQRAYSTICLLVAVGAHWVGLLPSLNEGMDWLFPLMALKFFICHGPRHEPYKYDV